MRKTEYRKTETKKRYERGNGVKERKSERNDPFIPSADQRSVPDPNVNYIEFVWTQSPSLNIPCTSHLRFCCRHECWVTWRPCMSLSGHAVKNGR